MHRTPQLKRLQAGFTLIELIIVIVVIGILAAVAIPQFTSVSSEATKAKNTATLGAVKSAWSVAMAVAKATPTADQVRLQMADPSCGAVSGGLSTCGSLVVKFATDPVVSPTDISCNVASECN